MKFIDAIVDLFFGAGFSAARQAEQARLRHEEMRKLTDDFWNGPLIRYGDDRFGKGD